MRKLAVLVSLAALLLLAVMPAFAQETPSLPEVLANDPDGRFTTLLAAVEAADLVDALSGEGPFTVLAPTNEAFDAALNYLGVSAEDLLADTDTLTEVLTYHVIPDRYFFRQLTSGPTLETLHGDTVTFDLTDGAFTVEGASILDVDNVASNGVMHVLESVILPPAIREAAAANRAHIRVAHLSPDAGAVDVWINGAVSDLTNVSFGTISGWIEVPAGAYSIGLAAAGAEDTENAFLGRVEPGSWTTIAAHGQATTDDLDVSFLAEDYSALNAGQARVSVFHAIQNAPAVDIVAGGTPLILNLGYPGTQGDNDGFATRNVGTGTVDLAVVPLAAEDALLTATLTLTEGNNYFIAAAGTPANPQLITATTNVAEVTGTAAGE